MQTPQIQLLIILGLTMALFIWGRWRHDLVALGALLACVLSGLVHAESAFIGFAHPAVITVGAVLILSRGLLETGAVDSLTRLVLPQSAGPMIGIASLAGLGAVLSAVMNNVGAMALLLPVALQLAGRWNMAPSRVLMPMAFGTILGGMTTLIGTPPNLIVSGFRAEATGAGFGMFDFTPVGAAVAVTGWAFVSFLGWRLVPAREKQSIEDFDTGVYLAEARVEKGSSSIGRTLGKVTSALEQRGGQVVGMVRNNIHLFAPYPQRRLREDDVLLIQAEPDDLGPSLSAMGLTLGQSGTAKTGAESSPADEEAEETRQGPAVVQEVVIMPGSSLAGRSPAGVKMDARYGISLLAVSRQGQKTIGRVRTMRFRPGDLLLLQGAAEALSRVASEYGLVPLAPRDIRLPSRSKAWAAGGIVAAAIALAALGILPVAASFALGVLAMGTSGIIAPRDLYRAVDWPVIVLLAALIPVAGAMAQTGTADLLADLLFNQLAQGNPLLILGLLLVVTMTLSDFMNNAATAAVMCPIALSSAQQLGVSADPLLMAVAIGASCAFLTPIGHQNNTLIMGPAGLRFGDYWRLGLPVEGIVVVVSVPLLLWLWPL